MSNVTGLHAPTSAPEKIDVDGEVFVNVAGVIEMARRGNTPQCRSLSRFYSAEYRALEGQPLDHAERELRAFRAAWERMRRKYGVQPINWDGIA